MAVSKSTQSTRRLPLKTNPLVKSDKRIHLEGDDSEIINSHLNGESINSIAQRLGRTWYIVKATLKKNQIKCVFAKTVLSEAEKQEVISLYRSRKFKNATICHQYGISRGYLGILLNKYGVQRYALGEANKKHHVNDAFFSSIDSEEKAWLLGFITTDGSVSGNLLTIRLKKSDRGTLEKIGEILESSYPVSDGMASIKSRNKRYPYSGLSVRSNQLTADLASLGVVPNKTLTVPFWNGDCKFMRHYVRGLVDGDGSLFFCRRWHLSFVGNELITAGMANYIQSALSVPPGVQLQVPPVYRLDYNKQTDVQTIVKHLYQDSNISLPRKKVIADLIINQTFRRYNSWKSVDLDSLESDYSKLKSWRMVAERLNIDYVNLRSFVARRRKLRRDIMST